MGEQTDDGDLRAALRQAQAYLHDFIEFLPAALIEVDLATGKLTLINRVMSLIFGYTAEDVAAGVPAADLFAPEDGGWVLDAVRRMASPSITSGTTHQHLDGQEVYEVTMVRRDGTRFPAEIQGSLVLDQEGVPRRIRALIADITERRRTSDLARRTEQYLRTVASHAPVVIFAIDPGGRWTFREGRAIAGLGIRSEDVVGHSLRGLEAAQPALAASFHRALAGETIGERIAIGEVELELRVEPITDHEGRPAGIVGIAYDVTELVSAERALIRVQKIESLGELAGGVSHDFNNILTAILGAAGVLRLSPDLHPDAEDAVATIELAARRGAEITGRLLSFARGGQARFEAVDLCEVLSDSVRLLRITLSPNVGLHVDLAPEPVLVEGDPAQLQQAFLNLLLNARDAIAESGAITLSLRAGGASAIVEVADDGVGMDAETQRRLFEPFYSRKRAKGTGLGTSIVYAVVRSHKGTIDVRSTLGRGSRFTVALPLRHDG